MVHCLLDNDRITLFVIHIKVRDNLSKECHNQFGARPDTIEITEKYCDWWGGQMQSAVRLIDAMLRKQGGLFEFSDDTEVIFRLQLRGAPHSVTIDSEFISRGDPVLALHTWNERMPRIAIEGADLTWALQLRRQLIQSFRAIAQVMLEDSRYAPVRALCGASALFSLSDHTGGTKMMQHLGFTVIPYYRPFGRFGEFWENLFSWWLMWAYNDPSRSSRKFWHLQRTEIWMTRGEFMKRYASASSR